MTGSARRMAGRVLALWRVWVGVGALALVAVAAGGACEARVAPGVVPHRPGMAVPDGAAIHDVAFAPVAARVDVVGTVQSEERINLSARIPAYVQDVFVSAGDRVQKGQVLLALDDREIREQLAVAEAQLAQAQAEYERQKKLFETQAATEQAYTAAESAYRTALAQLERTKVMRSYARIESPIDGIVTDRRIEIGDLANPGQVLVTVYDPTRMRLEAPVPVRLVDALALEQSVDVRLDQPSRVLSGRITQIVSEIDPLSRTRLVKIRLDTPPDDALLPGTFGRLEVEEAPRPACFVPRSAVYALGQLRMVQVVRDGRAIRRLVKTGPVRGDRIEILSGLSDGDRILVNPVQEG